MNSANSSVMFLQVEEKSSSLSKPIVNIGNNIKQIEPLNNPSLLTTLKFPMWIDGYTREEIAEFSHTLDFILDLPEGHRVMWKKLKSETIGFEPYLLYTHADQLIDDVLNSFLR